MPNIAYWTATYISKFMLLPPYSSIRAVGKQNVPRKGPVILISNHLNDSDPGVICTTLPRHVVYLAKAELFRIPVFGWFMRTIESIPVRRNEADLASLRQGGEALAKGLAVCVFAEGTGSKEKAALMEAHPGAGLLALRHTDVPIVPVAITGSQHLPLPQMFLRPFRRHRVVVTYGEPFHLSKPERLNSEAARVATRSIMERIAALLPPSYRGYYGYAGSDVGASEAK